MILQKDKLIVFGAVLLGISAVAINVTVVATALPRIAADLNALDGFAWVVTSYMITSATTLPIFGKLSDLYGRKIFFLGGIVVLLVGSVLAATSQDILQLSIYRGIQGVGGGAIFATSLAITGDLFPPAEQGKWRALVQGVFATASILAPIVGGIVTDQFSWRWVFYLSFPIGVVAFAVSLIVMPSFRRAKGHGGVDFLGAGSLALSVMPLLLAFGWAGHRYAWNSQEVVTLFVFSGLMLLVFLAIENKAKEPIIPLFLFRSSIFSVSSLIQFLVGMGLFGAIVYLPLFFQAVRSYSATTSAVALMPLMVASFASGVVGGQALSRWGKYKFLAIFSTGVSALGMFLIWYLGLGSIVVVIGVLLFLVGTGFGIAMSLFMVIAQNAFEHQWLGVAVSFSAFLRTMGGAVGVAVMGTIVNSRFLSSFQENLSHAGSEALQISGFVFPSTPQALLNDLTLENLRGALEAVGRADRLPEILDAMRLALADGLSAAFLLAALVLALACLASLFLREIPLRREIVDAT